MNKRKIAIFVEGQAELIFTRDLLSKWFQHDSNVIGFDCYNLRSNNFNYSPYKMGSMESENYYMIVNVGNDRSVLSKMISEAPRLKNTGYQTIIGLRDMFCDDYHKKVMNRTIHSEINEKFIAGTQETINHCENKELLHFHYAIMEVETWILGMYQVLEKINNKLTPAFIKKQLKVDLTTNDPESHIYHPAQCLDNIYGLVGEKYGKHEGDIARITAQLTRQNYKELLDSPNCSSFNKFTHDVLNLD